MENGNDRMILNDYANSLSAVEKDDDWNVINTQQNPSLEKSCGYLTGKILSWENGAAWSGWGLSAVRHRQYMNLKDDMMTAVRHSDNQISRKRVDYPIYPAVAASQCQMVTRSFTELIVDVDYKIKIK